MNLQFPPATNVPIVFDLRDKTRKLPLSPVWLRWFIDLRRALNDATVAAAAASGSGGTAGTYTPTLTDVANLDASTAFQSQYSQVGAVVTVSGKVSVDPTAPGVAVQLGIELPVASNIGAAEDVGGVAFATAVAGQGAGIIGDAANNRAELVFIAGIPTAQVMSFIFQYRVI